MNNILLKIHATHKEPRNIYYTLRDDEATVRRILETFGLTPDEGHVINGHVPVIVKKKERPLKAGGKLIVIDGGFARAYQQKTGIAGYTLVFNSWGLLLATHQRGEANSSTEQVIHDIDCTTEIIEHRNHRIRIKDTDLGREIQQRIDELMALHDAYRKGKLCRHSMKSLMTEFLVRTKEEISLNTTTILTDFDHYLMGEGSHERTYEKMGAHLVEIER